MNKTEYSNFIFSKIVNELKGKGYKIANCLGIAELPTDKTHIGILKSRISTKRRIPKGLLKFRTRALFIGTLWLNNEARGAKVDKQWILEVYGKEHLEELTEVVKKIAKRYKVNVVVNLEDNKPHFERFYSEYTHIY